MRKALLPFVLTIPSLLGYGELGYCPLVKEYDLAEEKCLATMIYGEARGENLEGQVAVAYTARNRVGKAQNKTVCNVVLAPKQYSIFNDNPALRAAAMDPNIEPRRKNVIDEESWETAVKVAQDVMRNKVDDPTDGATHYLAPKLMAIKKYRFPKWSFEYKMVAHIGNHKFYKPKEKS